MISTIQKLVLAFVTLIIGIVLIGSISDSTIALTQLSGIAEIKPILNSNTTYINDTTVYTVSHTETVNTCPLTNFVLTNQSGFVLPEGATQAYIVDLTTGTYTIRDTAGGVAALMASGLYNNSYVSYDYCPTGYVSGWGGTILNLVPGFFALAILGFSLGMFYSLGKEAGIL